MQVLTPPLSIGSGNFTGLEYGSQLISRFLIEISGKISGKISGFQQRFLEISPKVYEISTSVGPLVLSCFVVLLLLVRQFELQQRAFHFPVALSASAPS